jgi:phosphoserine phosphatase
MDTPQIRIFLVRHGQTEWNRTHRFQGRSDVPLNEKGRNQARALAGALAGQSFTAIYASPLKRAVETARLATKYHPPIPFYTEDDFMEMALGDFEGVYGADWIKQYPDFLEAWQKNPATVQMPGGECLKEVQTRALKALNRIIATHPPETTLMICSHNFVILSILCHAMGISLDHFRELKQATAAYSVICKDEDGFSTEAVNVRDHLDSA